MAFWPSRTVIKKLFKHILHKQDLRCGILAILRMLTMSKFQDTQEVVLSSKTGIENIQTSQPL